MTKREKLLRSPEYWFEAAQNEFFRQLSAYMEHEGLSRTQLAEKLGVTKGYISQILNGNFNYTLKKLIELSLSIDVVPQISYQPIDAVIAQEHSVKFISVAIDKSERLTIPAESDATKVTQGTEGHIYTSSGRKLLQVA